MAGGVEKGIDGAGWEEVHRLCERVDAEDLRQHYTPEEMREEPTFPDKCYYVTHKVYSASRWCQHRLIPEEWARERRFMDDHLEYVMREKMQERGPQ